jgi:3-deoxy-7-phosphoheptulonate synthase
MIVVVQEGASPEERDDIARILASRAGGYIPTSIHTSQGEVFCLPRGAATPEAEAQLRSLAGVERVVPLATTYQLASRAFQPEKTVVQVGEARIGGEEPVIIAGP